MYRRILTAAALGLALTATGLVPAAASDDPIAEVVIPDPTSGARPTDRGDLPELEAPAGSGATHAEDHVLVTFAPRTSGAQQRAALEAVGAERTGVVEGTGYVEVAVGDEDLAAVVARLEVDPSVAAVQLDHVRHASAWTNDELLDWAWPYVDLVRLPRAWDASTGVGTTIAVLDTGVTANHPDLAGSVLPGIDLVSGDSDASDPNGHGTMVAGVAAAHGNNTVGSVGAAYGAKILPVRVLDENGEGNDSTVVTGIDWAVDHGADVINLSLGGAAPSPVLHDAIAAAVAAGVAVVAAAGNEGTQEQQYPAAYAPQVDGLLAVSATGDAGELAGFSSWGDWVSIAAPGYAIVGPHRGGGYASASGTSFAAPLVAGAAALLVSDTGSLTPAQVEERLVTTARDAGPRGIDPYYGAGVLDAASAVTVGDARPAAVAVPLDRAPGDGATDDTRAVARVVPQGAAASGTLSPEGDTDWFSVRSALQNWTEVRVTVRDQPVGAESLEPVVQVYDTSGAVLARSLWNAADSTARVKVRMVDGYVPLFVSVTNGNGSASTQGYDLTVTSVPDGRFVRTGTPTAPSEPGALGLGDVTGDGRIDAVAVTFGGTLVVLPGKGDGTLGAAMPVPAAGAVVAWAHSIAVADLDGDGLSDVVAPTATGFAVLLQRAGTLVAGTPLTLPGVGWYVTAGDLDGDSDVDLVLANQTSATTVLLGAGDGTFTAGPVIAAALGATAIGDVDSDGRADIVGTQQIVLQPAAGTFAAPVSLSQLDVRSPRVQVGDVTGDGRADIVRTSQHRVVVDAQLAGGGFAPSVNYAAGELPGAPTLGDVDGDGRLDVLVLNSVWGAVTVLLQRPGGTLGAPEGSPMPYGSHNPATGLQVADLDKDGDLDVVASADAVYALRQVPIGASGPTAGWVKKLTPAAHSSGAAPRQVVSIGLERPLVGPVPAGVRLLDASGEDVPVGRVYVPATSTIELTPTVDLTEGGHYEVIVDGLTDATGTQHEPVRSWFTVAAGGDRFTPIDPVRVLDTRDGIGRLESGWGLQLDFSPLPADATAVVLNVTAANPSAPGNIRVYPSGIGAPQVSNLNVMPGVDQPNLVTVALGADRSVILLPEATTTDLIADLAGYYGPGGGTAFEPLPPTRVMDMRDGTGVRQGTLRGGQWVDLTVADGTLVPEDAAAVVLNVTGTQVTGATHVRVFPTPGAGEDQTPPDISNLNLAPGRDQPNLVTVKVGDGGRVRFFTPVASAFLIADVAGYYTSTGDHGFVPVTPARLGDTRSSSGFTGKLVAGKPQDLAVTGRAGVPSDAVAAVLNVTGVHPTLPTHVRAYPTAPGTPPDISTINLVPGRDDANLALVKLGTGGKASFFTPVGATDLVVDVSGYFRR